MKFAPGVIVVVPEKILNVLLQSVTFEHCGKYRANGWKYSRLGQCGGRSHRDTRAASVQVATRAVSPGVVTSWKIMTQDFRAGMGWPRFVLV